MTEDLEVTTKKALDEKDARIAELQSDLAGQVSAKKDLGRIIKAKDDYIRKLDAERIKLWAVVNEVKEHRARDISTKLRRLVAKLDEA